MSPPSHCVRETARGEGVSEEMSERSGRVRKIMGMPPRKLESASMRRAERMMVPGAKGSRLIEREMVVGRTYLGVGREVAIVEWEQ